MDYFAGYFTGIVLFLSVIYWVFRLLAVRFGSVTIFIVILVSRPIFKLVVPIFEMLKPWQILLVGLVLGTITAIDIIVRHKRGYRIKSVYTPDKNWWRSWVIWIIIVLAAVVIFLTNR